MKKAFCIVVGMLVLAGCSVVEEKIVPITKGISFSCEIYYYNEYFECECEIHNNGEMRADFTYPFNIEGLKYNFSKNGASVEFDGIEYIDDKLVFEKTAIQLVYEVLSNANSSVLAEKDQFYIKGKTQDFEYKLLLGLSGLPIMLETQPDIIKVCFKNVKIE